MRNLRRNHDRAFKAKVALEAIKGEKTVAQISSEYGVHSQQIRQWRKHLLLELPGLFSDKRQKTDKDREELESELYRQIGQLKVELEWLKKNLNSSGEQKRTLIDPEHVVIPIERQCALLGISRSAYYYQKAEIDPLDLTVMEQIDEQYTRAPFYGVLRMTAWLRRCGHGVNPKRVRRLMRLMGLEAIYPKPNLSKAAAVHPKYPYLLRGLTIDVPIRCGAPTSLTFGFVGALFI